MSTEYILQNLESILTNENFIGIGSTRKVYRYKNFVIKIFLHKLGNLQSLNELDMYKYLEERNLTKHYCPSVVY
ncbi:hypothetical protein [Solibacillus sp. CAU 1738]|uniref:hypothetical protein n=1 Tax=Solibacillus sp. CAU 1738 TaxID=3140363 RepID=UPI003261712D